MNLVKVMYNCPVTYYGTNIHIAFKTSEKLIRCHWAFQFSNNWNDTNNWFHRYQEWHLIWLRMAKENVCNIVIFFVETLQTDITKPFHLRYIMPQFWLKRYIWKKWYPRHNRFKFLDFIKWSWSGIGTKEAEQLVKELQTSLNGIVICRIKSLDFQSEWCKVTVSRSYCKLEFVTALHKLLYWNRKIPQKSHDFKVGDVGCWYKKTLGILQHFYFGIDTFGCI